MFRWNCREQKKCAASAGNMRIRLWELFDYLSREYKLKLLCEKSREQIVNKDFSIWTRASTICCLCSLCTWANFHLIQPDKCAILCPHSLQELFSKNIYSFLYFSHHFAALFSAVENGHLEKARTILESTDVDVNRYSEFYPLSMTATAINFTKTPFYYYFRGLAQLEQWWFIGIGCGSFEQQSISYQNATAKWRHRRNQM